MFAKLKAALQPRLKTVALEGAVVALSTAAIAFELLRQPGDKRAESAPAACEPVGWRTILVRTAREFGDDNIPLISAGVSFYIMLSIFPAMVAFVSAYGLIANVADVPHHLGMLSGWAPAAALDFIGDQMTRLAMAQKGGLTWTAIIAFAVALWSANSASKAMFMGLNIAYEEREKRGLIGLNLASLGFTLGMIVLAVIVAALLSAPAILPDSLSPLLDASRWPAQFLVLLLGYGLLYRLGPSRLHPRWQMVSAGALLAAALSLAISALFSFYVAHVARFEAVYGPLAAGVGFLIWVYWSVLIVLLGAELNAEIERAAPGQAMPSRPR